MKLKLTTKPQAAPAAPPPAQTPAPAAAAAAAPTPSSAAPKLKFKALATPVAAQEGGSQPSPILKIKRKYTKAPKADEGGAATATPAKTKTPALKKRPRDDIGGGLTSPPTKRKSKPTAKVLARDQSDDDMDDELVPPPQPVRVGMMRQGSTLKLRMKTPGSQKAGAVAIKIKNALGKPPVRPPGVGYDSEAEEAEEDPAIESQFVLRMQPGPDCDILRKAIEEKRVGRPKSEGGQSVRFRFFDREGRRSLVTIGNNHYAAAMVDLPCVIESMKSWNKKDWVKTADICQMLLVLGPVKDPEEAKKYPLPREIDPHKHQYPHGLTPPMHYVRKRRFRPRQSYHEIEQREAQVNALIEADEYARTHGGSTEYTIIDESKMESEEESSEDEGDYEDVAPTTEYVLEGEAMEGGEHPELEVEMEDNDDLEAMMMAGFHGDGDGDDMDLFGGQVVEVETPTSHDVAMHALGGEAAVSTPGTPVASTPNEPTSPEDDDDDDDEDAESGGEEEVDAAAVAAQEGREQALAEIRELEQELGSVQEQHKNTPNILYKNRLSKRIEQLKTDIDLKKAAIGLGEDGD